MTDKETARQQIAALVEKFRNTPKTLRDKYSEQQTREAFILPMFRALGWNTENPAEMTAEEQISRGFVDFGFYLNSVPVFYLETKKASEKLEKPEFMKQAINYAFLKGVTWAVLTDFEQLMVFNAEWEESEPVKARFLNLEHERYVTDQFEDLWLLSKPSVLNHEIDRTAERFGKKSLKQPVTETLFKQLTVWRRELFTQMRTYGQTLWATDPRAVDNAVQKFLDRMIFIRTVEDRGVEPNQLRSLVRQATNKNIYTNLLKLFRDLDAVYNSNLFAESDADRMEVHDPALIREIAEGLYGDRFVNYDFNAITADVLGAVYEQYLGFKAQDPEGKTALDPRKQEKRKKQGIYYTPQFVVRYIVRQTLGNLLETGVDAHNLRILDPACGSGSFLIEAFDVLDRWLATNGDENDRKFPRRRRMRILQENLYGVDLDEQAVEVTRLNLMLRAAIERDKLPLLTHIQHGNSLIDDPAIAGDTAFKWEERFPLVFAGHDRALWFVTFVTHNSRVSERMVEFGVQAGDPVVFNSEQQIQVAELIAQACRQYDVPVVAWNVLPDHVHMIIGAEDEAVLTEYVRKIKGYSSYAFVPLSGNGVVAESDTVSDKGLKPLVLAQVDSPVQADSSTLASHTESENSTQPKTGRTGQGIWAQKFNKWLITDQAALNNITEYVMNNHEKHTDQWGDSLLKVWNVGFPDKGQNKGLKPLVQIVEEVCVSAEEAAHVRGGFDVVIGNPPYGATISESESEYYKANYATAVAYLDTFVVFMELALHLLKPFGVFGMIVPSGWVSAPATKQLRQTFLAQFIPRSFASMPYDVFKNAYIDTVITIGEKLPIGSSLAHLKEIPVELVAFPPKAKIQSMQDFDLYLKDGNARKWLDDPNVQFLVTSSHSETILISKLQSANSRLSDIADIQRGVTPFALTKIEPDINPAKAFNGTVRRYSINDTSETYFIRYDESLAEYKPERYFKGSRILLRELISRQFQLQAVHTDEDFITNKSMQSLLVKDSNYHIFYLLGFINSKIMSWYFLNISSVARRDDFPKIVLKQTRELPIRTINFDDPTDKAHHDQMVALVEKMLRLKQEHAAAEANLSDDRHRLAEDIERTDKAIDQLVYQLYDLTPEEIALVEGSRT